jgi:hypothetical protein
MVHNLVNKFQMISERRTQVNFNMIKFVRDLCQFGRFLRVLPLLLPIYICQIYNWASVAISYDRNIWNLSIPSKGDTSSQYRVNVTLGGQYRVNVSNLLSCRYSINSRHICIKILSNYLTSDKFRVTG